MLTNIKLTLKIETCSLLIINDHSKVGIASFFYSIYVQYIFTHSCIRIVRSCDHYPFTYANTLNLYDRNHFFFLILFWNAMKKKGSCRLYYRRRRRLSDRSILCPFPKRQWNFNQCWIRMTISENSISVGQWSMHLNTIYFSFFTPFVRLIRRHFQNLKWKRPIFQLNNSLRN